MKKQAILILSLCTLGFAIGCSPTASQLKKTLEDNPEIVFNVIEKHPKAFLDTVNKAATQARDQVREDAEKEEQMQMENEFKNPKNPSVTDSDVIFGNKNAPVTIVEYSDFQCPYCEKGYNTIKQVMKEYGDKVRVVFKNLPLDFHPMAMPAAKYFEAIGLQSHAKAEKFHDEIFNNQSKLGSGKEDFLKSAAKKAGADLAQLMKDVNSDKVKALVEADMEEAKKFEFSGTPGFLINGVSLKGAYPFEEFKKIIDRHLDSSKGT